MSNKTMGVLAYFIFFLPLLVDSKNEFGRFHSNQGLLVFILSIIASIVGSIIPILGWVGSILVLVLAIIGIINASKEEMKELPLIGSIKIIK
jgi:uncharacterized membrane protein